MVMTLILSLSRSYFPHEALVVINYFFHGIVETPSSCSYLVFRFLTVILIAAIGQKDGDNLPYRIIADLGTSVAIEMEDERP